MEVRIEMKVIVLKKKTLILAAAAVVAAAAVIVGLFRVVPAVTAMAGNKKTPIYRVDRADKEISMSFDAAWGKAIIRTN